MNRLAKSSYTNINDWYKKKYNIIQLFNYKEVKKISIWEWHHSHLAKKSQFDLILKKILKLKKY